MNKRTGFFQLIIVFMIILAYQNNVLGQDQKFYLGYNLWYQNPDKVLSINPKLGKYLPAGVEIDQVRTRGGGTPMISFRVVKMDRRFIVHVQPKYHRGIKFDDFKNALIQTKNFQELTSGLSRMEIDNIMAGKVEPGMSRRAVLLAYGPPAQHRTPDINATKWAYWTKTSARPFEIVFDSNGLTTTAGQDDGSMVETGDDRLDTGVVAEDTSPPVIVILDPPIARGMKPKQKEKSVVVRGKATDPSGVFEVLVNNVEANLQADGGFWAEVFLAVGENQISVKATDTRMNSSQQTFSIIREAEVGAPPIATVDRSSTFSFGLGKYYALIIAVQDYADRSINNLEHPINDARQLKNILISNYTFEPQNVILLENPDRATIMNNFETLSKKVGKNDNFFVFYAGHGYWDEKFQQGYWLPSNANKDTRTQWISNSTIVDYIRGIESNHTLLVADACFSGGIFQTRKAFSDITPAVEHVAKYPSRKAMTSGTLKEVPDRSVFVEYMSKRLQDNREKYLTSEKLFISFKDAVINNSPIHQIPQYGEIRQCGDEGGDFIFIRR
jgi:hypothetical protein